MSARLVYLSAVSALVISACATSQENPNYKFSTKYKAATPQDTRMASHTAPHTYGSTGTTVQPVSYNSVSTTTASQPVTYVSTQPAAPVVLQPAAYNGQTQSQASSSVVYQSTRIPSLTQATTTQRTMATGTPVTTYTRVDNNCLKRETRNEVIGGALGGTVGAFAGEKLVGGTKGALLGAAIGGTAGYGLGDKSVNCDPVAIPAVQSSTVVQPYQQSATYQTVTHQSQPQVQYQQTQTQTQYSQTQPQYGTTYASTTAPLSAPVVVQPPAPPSYSAPTYTAPTDQAYGETFGTPGYHAVMAAQGQSTVPAQPQTQVVLPPEAYLPIPQSAPAPQVAYAPQQPSYAPQQPLYQPAQIPAATMPGNMHLVVEGNTVYSLSKQLCVEPAEIQQTNGLDAAFNIKLGQYLKMPASRC